MTLDRAGAFALYFASAAMLLVMGLHPDHVGPPLIGAITLSGFVHALAIVVTAPLLFGGGAIAHHLGREQPLSVLGLCFLALGGAAVLIAATMSGFVMPQIADAAHGAQSDAAETFRAAARLTVWINQAFANVHVMMFTAAILTWSLIWPRSGAGGKALTGFGVVSAFGLFAWQMSGAMRLDIHGMGLVVLIHGAWFAFAATLMLRPRRP